MDTVGTTTTTTMPPPLRGHFEALQAIEDDNGWRGEDNDDVDGIGVHTR